MRVGQGGQDIGVQMRDIAAHRVVGPVVPRSRGNGNLAGPAVLLVQGQFLIAQLHGDGSGTEAVIVVAVRPLDGDDFGFRLFGQGGHGAEHQRHHAQQGQDSLKVLFHESFSPLIPFGFPLSKKVKHNYA